MAHPSAPSVVASPAETAPAVGTEAASSEPPSGIGAAEAAPAEPLKPRATRTLQGTAGPTLRRPIAVLYNADYLETSSENDPGWAARSDIAHVAAAITAALRESGHDAHLVPAGADLPALADTLRAFDSPLVFNLCESICGEARLESAMALVLELMGLPFTGSPSRALALAVDKGRTRAALEAAGVPVPAGLLVPPGEPLPAALDAMPLPAIVKPAREDASVGIHAESVVRTREALHARVRRVHVEHRQPALVEQYIDGREVSAVVFGHPSPRVLQLSEIDFSAMPAGLPHIVTYAAKWDTGSPEDLGTIPRLNPDLPPRLAERVREVALLAFRALGLRDYGRVDMRCTADGDAFVIDVNPNCDLAPNAGFARAAASVGLDYRAMCDALVRNVARRASRRRTASASARA